MTIVVVSLQFPYQITLAPTLIFQYIIIYDTVHRVEVAVLLQNPLKELKPYALAQ